MLGLFDSGLGGLTVLRRVRERLPGHDLVFFADQAHVPYGDRSIADLSRLLRDNIAFLNDCGADAIVMACNTSCAAASQFGWPSSRAAILDLIESAAVAVAREGYRRVGVVATAATTASKAYTRQLRAHAAGIEVFEVAAPALVPLVEAGKFEGPQTRAEVAAACEQLPRDLDAVILACTHYPLLDSHFAAVLGGAVARVDPALVQAERAAAVARERGSPAGSGRTSCVTSGDIHRFRDAIARTLGTLEGLDVSRRDPAVFP